MGFNKIYAWNESCSLKPCIQITPNHSFVFKMAAISGQLLTPNYNAQIIGFQMVHVYNLLGYRDGFKPKTVLSLKG